jgi:hypothetical protein
MLNAKIKAVRIANLTPAHQTVNTVLKASGQTLSAIAAVVGIGQDPAEKQLSILIDEGLAMRTKGGRLTALYSAS